MVNRYRLKVPPRWRIRKLPYEVMPEHVWTIYEFNYSRVAPWINAYWYRSRKKSLTDALDYIQKCESERHHEQSRTSG